MTNNKELSLKTQVLKDCEGDFLKAKKRYDEIGPRLRKRETMLNDKHYAKDVLKWLFDPSDKKDTRRTGRSELLAEVLAELAIENPGCTIIPKDHHHDFDSNRRLKQLVRQKLEDSGKLIALDVDNECCIRVSNRSPEWWMPPYQPFLNYSFFTESVRGIF